MSKFHTTSNSEYYITESGKIYRKRIGDDEYHERIPAWIRNGLRIVINNTQYSVAYLVAQAFVPKPGNDADYCRVKFKDNNPRNVDASNLYWTMRIKNSPKKLQNSSTQLLNELIDVLDNAPDNQTIPMIPEHLLQSYHATEAYEDDSDTFYNVDVVKFEDDSLLTINYHKHNPDVFPVLYRAYRNEDCLNSYRPTASYIYSSTF